MTEDRKRRILEALALELQDSPGGRITTARLAAKLGVSEAALYRHFPSKRRMLEALIEFAEDSLLGRLNQILEENAPTAIRCERTLFLLLGFAERNPGISRLLLGEALAGEDQRLHARVGQLFQRFEAQLRQVLREAALRGEPGVRGDAAAVARLLLTYFEGRLRRYVRSGFADRPLAGWETDWSLLGPALFGVIPAPT